MVDLPQDIQDFSLYELIKYLATSKVSDDLYIRIRDRILSLWNKKRYGFSPEPQLAKDLEKIGKSDMHRRCKQCLGKHHWALNLLRLGLKVREYSEKGQVETIDKIKGDVLKRYGMKGVRIISMGVTGSLPAVIHHLSDLKLKFDFNKEDMNDIFEGILKEWMDIAIFHKTEDGRDVIYNKIISYMTANCRIFFVFASGEAGNQAMKVIADLNNSEIIREKGYTFNLNQRNIDDTGRILFSWIFEQIEFRLKQ